MNNTNNKKYFLMILVIVSLLLASAAVCIATKYKTLCQDCCRSEHEATSAIESNSTMVGPYKINISNQHLYTTDQNNGIIITDKTGQAWMMRVKYTNEFSFAKIYSDTSILSRKYNDYRDLKIEKSTIHDKNTILLDGEKNGTKITHLFFKSDDTNTFIFDVINLSNIYDHDRLEDAYSIVESAQRQKFPESFRTDRRLFDLSNS